MAYPPDPLEVVERKPIAEAVVRIAPDMQPIDDSLGRLADLFRDVALVIDKYRGVVTSECACGGQCGCAPRLGEAL